jgi:hypothetical protein
MPWCPVQSGTCDQILLPVWRFLSCLFGAPSLTRGRVCSAMCSESYRTRNHNLLSRRPSTWRASLPFLYPPKTGWTSYTPGHWVPFSSLLTTRRATVGGILTLHTGILLVLCCKCQDGAWLLFPIHPIFRCCIMWHTDSTVDSTAPGLSPITSKFQNLDALTVFLYVLYMARNILSKLTFYLNVTVLRSEMTEWKQRAVCVPLRKEISNSMQMR